MQSIGHCESCRHLATWSEDPSPAGVSLSPGCIEYAECAYSGTQEYWDTVMAKHKITDEEECELGRDVLCPMWSPIIRRCSVCNKLFVEDIPYGIWHPVCSMICQEKAFRQEYRIFDPTLQMWGIRIDCTW